MVSVRDVAEYLGMHANTVKRIPATQLPYYRFGSRGWRKYREEDVKQYLEAHRAR